MKNTPHYSEQFGNWSSEITSDLIVSDSISIDEPRLNGNSVYYIERRPNEGGRCVIVKHFDNTLTDMLPAPYSARSRVHEYGGASYCLDDECIYFINDSDQDIYLINDQKITRITTTKDHRFSDFSVDKKRQRIIAVCEIHANNTTLNSLVSINIETSEINIIEQGDDFYASPKLNADASQICWQSWNHPNMPWDGNKLWLADINISGCIDNKKHIAGTDDISVCQPKWSPDNILHYIADNDGWWHIYRHNNEHHIIQLTKGEKEFGLPQWVFAQSSYAFIDKIHIICCYQSNGKDLLASLMLDGSNTLTKIETSWTHYHSIQAENNKLCFIAASSTQFPELVIADVNNESYASLHAQTIKSSCKLPLSNEHYSAAVNVNFTNRHGQRVYANYYPPSNPNYNSSSENSTPPLIVICHGGPTGQSGTSLDPRKQFWTSRGFALLDVNYSGSTGYGRAYRERLNNKWGKLDVEDCCDAALYAVSQKLANKDQLIIRGSSAGGYTVLSALTFEDVFSAGACYYGISELTSLASDTHKFESRYLDGLIGPYPEKKSLYEKRSPINSTEQLNCPVIFFQGIEDKVVPKEQAEKMFDALDKKGVAVAAQYYEGEQHGFRKAESIIQSLENELNFYQLIFKLKANSEIKFKGEIKVKNI